MDNNGKEGNYSFSYSDGEGGYFSQEKSTTGIPEGFFPNGGNSEEKFVYLLSKPTLRLEDTECQADQQVELSSSHQLIDISNHKIAEGMSAGTLVGLLYFGEGDYLPAEKVRFSLLPISQYPDNQYFKIISNKLRTRDILLYDENAELKIGITAKVDGQVFKRAITVKVLELPKFHLSGSVKTSDKYPSDYVIVVLYRQNEKGRFEAIEGKFLGDDLTFSFASLIQGVYTLSLKFDMDTKYNTIYLGNVVRKARATLVRLYEDLNEITFDLEKVRES